MSKIRSGALVVDVRTEGEYKSGAYPGSINIPLNALSRRLRELEPRTRPILTYCASGVRGVMAALMLQTYGWTDASCAGSLSQILHI